MKKGLKRAGMVRPAGRDQAAAGIDPARYNVQVAIYSPSHTYCNRKFPLSARAAQELAELLPPNTPCITEGYGTSGRLFFLELARHSIPCKELNPQLGRHLRFIQQESHTDRGDALAAAKAEFFWPERLAPICLSEGQEALATLVKSRRRLVKGNTADKNRLHRVLGESYGALYQTLNAEIDINTQKGRRFFTQFPSINALLHAPQGQQELERFFPDKAALLLAREQPWSSPLFLDALEAEARLLLAHIETTEKMVNDLKKKITTFLSSYQEACLLLSIPGVGAISAATLLTEVKTIGRFQREAQFAGYCGLGQLLFQSGDGKSYFTKRTMYNRALRSVFYDIAFAALSKNQQSRQYYDKKRQEGKSHRQALLRLARYYARIVYTVLTKQRTYAELFGEPSSLP